MKQKEIGFIDNLYIIVKWRKSLITTFFIVCFIAAGISLIIPKVHRAHTTIFPPVEETEGFGVSSLLSKLPLSNLGLGSGTSQETFTFLAILKSRTVLESVVNQFDLMNRYKTKNLEKTVKKLREKVKVNVNEEGTISLSADASTKWLPTKKSENEARRLARDMANYFISELDRVNKKLKIERAHNTRIFIEERFQQNIDDLHKAEEEFRKFQETYGAIALPEQTTATITAAAEIKAQIITKEIEANVLKNYVGKSYAEAQKIQYELDELKKKYNNFIKSAQNKKILSDDDIFAKDVFLPLEDVPNLGLQYARLYRDVMIQEKIMEFILPQYEQAKIQEAKDTPTVQVLDEAVIPVKRIKPKRAFFVLFWGALSLLISISIIFFIEFIDKMKETSPEKYKRIINIFNLLNQDLSKIRRKRINE